MLAYRPLFFGVFGLMLIFISCTSQAEQQANEEVKWNMVENNLPESSTMLTGETYLSLYPELYTQSKKTMLSFTSTVSIRNISRTDTLYLLSGEYYNTQGDKIKDYFATPVYVKPLETIEIIVRFEDDKGGSGANFIFDWMVPSKNSIPLIEGLMVSTMASQGMSFSTAGVNTIWNDPTLNQQQTIADTSKMQMNTL